MHSFENILKVIALYTLNRRIVWFMLYISKKNYFEKKDELAPSDAESLKWITNTL